MRRQCWARREHITIVRYVVSWYYRRRCGRKFRFARDDIIWCHICRSRWTVPRRGRFECSCGYGILALSRRGSPLLERGELVALLDQSQFSETWWGLDWGSG